MTIRRELLWTITPLSSAPISPVSYANVLKDPTAATVSTTLRTEPLVLKLHCLGLLLSLLLRLLSCLACSFADVVAASQHTVDDVTTKQRIADQEAAEAVRSRQIAQAETAVYERQQAKVQAQPVAKPPTAAPASSAKPSVAGTSRRARILFSSHCHPSVIIPTVQSTPPVKQSLLHSL